MKVDLTSSNPALENIFKNPNQIITLDANFLIPPDRSKYAHASISFHTFQYIWLDPIFDAFPNLAIHEAVYDELVTPSIKNYIDNYRKNNPNKFSVHTDTSLTPIEHCLRDSIEDRIYPLTNYDPNIDNKDDRGEVKSLAFIAVKGLPYFAAHDSNSIKLIEKAEKWSTGLDNVQAIKIYELIYYLYKKNNIDKKSLKMLYKYYYYVTPHEKSTNPEWGKFIKGMEALYLLD